MDNKTRYINGKDEMNLAEFPFAKLNTVDKRDIIEYEGWYTDDNKNRILQKWTVRAASGLGLPTELGERVLMALVALTADQGFESPRVEFSIYQIIQALGLTRNKRQYELIEKQLKQIVGITIDSTNAFWDHDKKQRITTSSAFHLVEKVWLRHKDDGQSTNESGATYGYIVWGDTIFNSFKSGYIKSLDLNTYYSLPKPLSRRLYRFLDKRMRYQDEYEIDIFDLTNRLGCVRYKAPSQVKRVLQPAIDALVENGFLASGKFRKQGRYTRAVFSKVAKEQNPLQAKIIDISVPDSVSENDRLWQDTLDQLSGAMQKKVFDRWLRDTVIVSYADNHLVIDVKNADAKEWIEHRLLATVKRAIKSHFADVVDIDFVVM